MIKKAILKSIKPYWFFLIIEGRKKMELSKTIPKPEEWNREVFIYCSQDKKSFNRIPKNRREEYKKYIGKVCAYFTCDGILRQCNMQNADIAELRSCVKREQIFEYSGGKEVFGMEIENLVIFDTPKELCEFNNRQLVWRGNNHIHIYAKAKKPPQSWFFIEAPAELYEN